MKDKVEWFRQQCKAKRLSAKGITVYGEYATNAKGDFLYSVKHRDGRYTMSYRTAPLGDCESIYPEWLLELMMSIDEECRQGDEAPLSRAQMDRKEIARCFKEAICRTKWLQKSWREELRRSPTIGVYPPAVPIAMRCNDYEQGISYGMYPGIWYVEDDPERIDKEGNKYHLVRQPDELKCIEGYRFALKVANLDQFIQIYSYMRDIGQRGPFQMLAELENSVIQAWKEHGEVRDRIYMRQPVRERSYLRMEGLEFVKFSFSHFEVENEPDAAFRTIFVVYSETYDV